MATHMLMLTNLQALDSAAARTVWEVLQSGGPVMVPIGIASVLVVALTIDRFLGTVRSRICPTAVKDAAAKIHESGDVDAALASLDAARDNSPAGRVLRAGVRRRGFQLRDIEGAFEDQGQKEAGVIMRRVQTLMLIAAVTPLLGLLGTVLGIAESFQRVSAAGMGKPEMLAGGIYEALTTTIAGLCVAIPAMLLGSYLKGRAARAIGVVDETVSPCVEALAVMPRRDLTSSMDSKSAAGSSDSAGATDAA